ncbi:MAG: hypothetical protein ABH865_07870 [Candidatus Omnitrophota bacterium]
MTDNKQSDFYTSYKISKSFKIFLVLFSIIGLLFLGYSLVKTGENLKDAIVLVASAAGAIVLLFWFIVVMVNKIRNPENISNIERSYAEDLGRYKVVAIVKKYVFSDMDIGQVLNLIVIMGGMFKWLLFYIFAGGTAMVFLRNDTLFNKILILALSVVWCPWLENICLKKINYILIFIVKVLATFSLFMIGIVISP